MWRETGRFECVDDQGVVYVAIEETEFSPSGTGGTIEGMKRMFLANGDTLTPANDPDSFKIAKTQQVIRRRS